MPPGFAVPATFCTRPHWTVWDVCPYCHSYLGYNSISTFDTSASTYSSPIYFTSFTGGNSHVTTSWGAIKKAFWTYLQQVTRRRVSFTPPLAVGFRHANTARKLPCLTAATKSPSLSTRQHRRAVQQLLRASP